MSFRIKVYVYDGDDRQLASYTVELEASDEGVAHLAAIAEVKALHPGCTIAAKTIEG
jgi:hypothetical protein